MPLPGLGSLLRRRAQPNFPPEPRAIDSERPWNAPFHVAKRVVRMAAVVILPHERFQAGAFGIVPGVGRFLVITRHLLTPSHS